MSVKFILLPLFVEVALTFILWFWMAYYRVTLVRCGDVQPRDVDLRQPNWPPHVLQIHNAAHNQIETPLLFYALTVLAIITRQADMAFVVLACIYVVFRLLHAYVHVTSNRVAVRGPLFGVSLLVLFIMWVVFAVHIIVNLS
ncbi:MAG: MAPEG family protein [Pseudolabrys sp.]